MIVKEKAFYQTVARIALPITIQSLMTFLINLTDTLMVGRLGEDALSGVNIAGQLFFIITLAISGICEGGNILIAQYYGKRDFKSIKKIFPIAYIGVFIFGIIAFCIGFFAPEQFIRIYANSQDLDVIEQGTAYLKIASFFYVPYALSQFSLRAQRALHRAEVATKISIITLIINFSLNFVLIFGMFGFPKLGVVGAAIGTVIARIVECILSLIYVFKIEEKIRLKISDLKDIDKDIYKTCVKYISPILANEIIWVLGTSAVAIIFGKLGKEVVAANTISSIMFQMASMLLFGLASSALVVIGNTVGSGDIKKAYEYSDTFAFMSIILGVLCSLLVFVTKDFVISLYELSPATVEIAHTMITGSAFIMFFQTFSMIGGMGVLRGGGDGKFVLKSEMIFLWLIAVPLGVLAAFVWELPIFWVYICAKIDEILKAVAFGVRVFSKKWAKNVTEDM